MLSYEEFKKVLTETFMDHMPEQFRGMEVSVTPVNKVNVTFDGLTISEKGAQISPTIYINDIYERYERYGNLEEAIMAACDIMENAYAKVPSISVNNLLDGAKDKVVFVLVNTEQNKSLLDDVPHREFLDLSIMYRIVINKDQNGIQSTKVTNELAERLGMNEEQLFKCAAENTKRIFPPTVKNMNDVMRDLYLKSGVPEDIAEMMIGEIPPEHTAWVISNKSALNGAASMLYENELYELAENLGSDLYILPSSVHEVLAVSAASESPEELAEMVVQVNKEEVSLDERFSNQVYHYDRELRRVCLATDTHHKCLTD